MIDIPTLHNENQAVLPSLGNDNSTTGNNLPDPPETNSMKMYPVWGNRTPTNSSQPPPVVFRHPNFHFDFPLCLVHIGKAAGSSLSCGLGLMYADCEGMPRDRLDYVGFAHMRQNSCSHQAQHTATYLVTLRHPLTRFQSWFDFEKKIVPTRGKKSVKEIERIRQQRGWLFVECYNDFRRLVAKGLQPLPPHTNVSSIQPGNMSCPERAWAAALGVRAFSYHEWYNYEHYWNVVAKMRRVDKSFQDGRLRGSSLLVLRTEHLQDDWSHLSKENLFRPVNRGSVNTTSVRTTQQNLFNTTFSKEELQNLCRALCPEIQYYKRFLQLADNLNQSQKLQSLQELQNDCPLENSLEERPCPAIPFFSPIPVPRRKYLAESKKRLFVVSPAKRSNNP